MRREHGCWHGPAEIIALERNKVVWLSHLGLLVRASPEQLRPASSREWAKLPKDEKGHPDTTEASECPKFSGFRERREAGKNNGRRHRYGRD